MGCLASSNPTDEHKLFAAVAVIVVVVVVAAAAAVVVVVVVVVVVLPSTRSSIPPELSGAPRELNTRNISPCY